MLLFLCVAITFLAVGTFFSAKYPNSIFTNWFRKNIIDKGPEDNTFN